MSPEENLATFMGAAEAASPQVLTVFLPDHDQHENAFDAAPWVREAADLLAKIGGGATTMPAADGNWLSDDGRMIREKTVQVFSYIDPDRWERHLNDLRSFLHRFGIKTDQGEVAFEFDGRLFKIRKFNPDWANGGGT
jgi:hypothetical protein